MSGRALAHIEKINDIQPIPNATAIEVASVLGWKVVISKADNFKIGDKVVYIEIDSKVPECPEFEFLRDRKFRVRTIKLRGQYSQGLIVPMSILGEKDYEIGTDVTKELGITYYIPADNIRKEENMKNLKYQSMASRHKNLFKKPIFRWLMQRSWGRELLFLFFGKKKDKPKSFPTKFEFVTKSDETRCENVPWYLEDQEHTWIKTVKIDGTSSLYLLERKPHNKREYYVCSRNVRQLDENQDTFHSENVYWSVEFKYHIRDFLEAMLKEHPDWNYVAVQGETAGVGNTGVKIQGDPHQFGELRFFAYNFIDSVKGRWNSVEAKKLLEKYGIEFVPIVDTNYVLPTDMETFKLEADGNCEAPGAHGMREGFVYRRTDDCNISFKNVSRKYLLKHQDEGAEE